MRGREPCTRVLVSSFAIARRARNRIEYVVHGAMRSRLPRRRLLPPAVSLALLVVSLLSIPTLAARHPSSSIILSVVGTNDLHGSFLPVNGRGGLALLGGYVGNLRAVRAADGGGVVLLDAGDTFQGGIESNLSEGAVVVDAFNALGYTAAAIGNHEFDFGEVDRPGRDLRPLVRDGAEEGSHGRRDPRGALKARAAQARYPFLAANLIDDATGRPVEWPNVKPSVLVEAAGVKIGIVGVMTIVAMRSTLAANISGLRVAPLAPAIVSRSGETAGARRHRRDRDGARRWALQPVRRSGRSVVVRRVIRDLRGGAGAAARSGRRDRRRALARRGRAPGRGHSDH